MREDLGELSLFSPPLHFYPLSPPSCRSFVSISRLVIARDHGLPTKFQEMGCIPSKRSTVEDDVPSGLGANSTPQPRPRKQQRQRNGPPSLVVEGELPPWLQKRAVLTEKDGQLIIHEEKPMELP